MAQAKSDTPGSSDASRFHKDALNHCTKSRNDHASLKKLSTCAETMAVSIPDSKVQVTIEQLQDLMRVNRYVQRIVTGEFWCCIKHVGRPKEEGAFLGWFNLIVDWCDETGQIMLLTQCHITPSGDIGHSGRLDPKALVDDSNRRFSYCASA